MTRDVDKIKYLRQVQELIIHKDPTLLDNFLDEMLAFISDRSVDVKKLLIGFLEEACKKDKEILPKALPGVTILLADDNANVKKKVILSLTSIFKYSLQWIAKAKTPSSEMTSVWENMMKTKKQVLELLESENDGIRTHVVKFLEGVVLVLSKRSTDSMIPKNMEGDITLDQIPESNTYLKVNKLEEDGKKSFILLLQFQASPHISSINLMTVMGALTNIAKQRPIFLDQVVQGLEALHVNLPPTLAKSQVSSVRKNLKMQMLALLKHPASVDHLTQITTLLTDLGASQSEINKNMPKMDENRKRKLEQTSTSTSKKAKVEIDLDDDEVQMTPFVPQGIKRAPSVSQRQTAIDITAEDILPKLNSQNVADLVLLSMVMLPDTMPAQFESTYTPIAAAGTEAQIAHLARLLATQLTMAGFGRGLGELQRKFLEEGVKDDGSTTPASPMDASYPSPKQLIQTLVGGTTNLEDSGTDNKPSSSSSTGVPGSFLQPSMPAAPRKLRQFKLSTITNPLDAGKIDEMTIATMKRVLTAETIAQNNNITSVRVKILATLTAQFGGGLKDMLQTFIFEDLKTRSDIAFAWLYQEYANCQGFISVADPQTDKNSLASYDECLTRLLSMLLDRPDQRDGLFSRLILEAPVVTDNAVEMLRRYSANESQTQNGMETLRKLILMRPNRRLHFLDVLLEFTGHDQPEVRNKAIEITKTLLEKYQLNSPIETYALNNLKKLLLPKPLPEFFTGAKAKDVQEEWTEECIKMHLYLYLGLLPTNHSLIHELSNVYTATSADVKRAILRMLESPVKGMGMDSPELLTMVENCPKGAETLVMRVIHILTDKSAPSPELVEKIRDLYHKRVPDVRFLIPVLTGLTKKEVTGALPKLIKLNPVVVKEVFHRLMGGHGESSVAYTSPLTPAELLVALHNIDPSKCDMKTVIKAANLCFSEKTIYTTEVLAIAMQQLMEINPLPTLLMRTVLQSLSMYPRLIGFVLNILHRLITKQVWKQQKVWEGFIKCCQKTKPQSFQVLLQLPPQQLQGVFEIAPDLRSPLYTHVQSLTPHQQAHISKAVLSTLENDPYAEQRVKDEEKQRQDKENAEKLQIEKELANREKAERMRLEKEKADKEKAEKVKKEREKAENERKERERKMADDIRKKQEEREAADRARRDAKRR
ncbi:hypothetical protein LOTGIDRAFT_215976, partial [Lottia gigantea]